MTPTISSGAKAVLMKGDTDKNPMMPIKLMKKLTTISRPCFLKNSKISQ
jgi:hypothetical protein